MGTNERSVTGPPKPRWGRRVGTAVRRASSVLASQPKTPPTNSPDPVPPKVDIAPKIQVPPPRPPAHSAPSPVAESPVRDDDDMFEMHIPIDAYMGPNRTKASIKPAKTSRPTASPPPIAQRFIAPESPKPVMAIDTSTDRSPLPKTAPHPEVPSPIAESPAREAGSIEEPSFSSYVPPPAIDSPASESGPSAELDDFFRSLVDVDPPTNHSPSAASQTPATPGTPLAEMLTLEQSLYALRPRPGISTWEPEEPLQDPPVDHFPSPPTVRHPTVPSPIAESPVREAASIKDHAPIDPSHAEHAPPPKIDSAADGPGALVGESEELPQPADRSPSPPPSSHTVTPDPGSEPKRKRISSQNFQRLARRISLSTRRSSSSIIPGLKRDSSPRVSTDEGAGTSNDSPVGSITDKDKEEVMEEDKEEKKEEKKDKTNRGLAMVPSSTAEPPECETELDAKRVAEPEAGYESGRNHESLHRSVREAFAPDSMHEAEREAAREPAVENHALIGHSLPAQGIAIDETTLSTPVDEYVPPALISSAAGPGAFTDQEDLPLPMAVMDPAHPFPSSMYEEPHVAVPNALNEQTTPSRVEPIITDSYPDLLRMAESIAAPPMPTPSHQLCSNSGVDGDAVPEQEAEGVVMPDSRDAGGRSRAPSIRMPVCDSVADPTDPETDLPRPNESSPDILGPYEQVGGMSHAEDDDGIPAEMSVPDPDHVLRPIQGAAPSIRGFDIDETAPLLPDPGSSENILYPPPPAYPDHVTAPPSEVISVDCGMMPSRFIYPPGQGPSRRRVPSSQGAEQPKVGGGDTQVRAGWANPFACDSRPSNAHQRSPGEPLHGAYNVMHDSETRAFPHISPPSPSSNSSGYDSHLHSPANLHHATPSSTRHPPPHEDRPFNAHGWVEYLLPDESLYYVHQGYQVVADMDLSDEKLLDAMMAYLEDKCDVIPPGRELWLRDPGPREGGFAPLGWLVDHSKQSVAPHLPREANGDREGHDAQHECKDDRLDAKYRYWSFMEAHPAHTSLPPDAHQDAIDALHWATTNGLIHSHPGRSAPAPFTQEECQSLTTLLQSIRKRGETPLRTHTVSKILLRVVCWRQSHSRPDKPLPVDAGRDGLRRRDPMPVQSSGFILSTGVYVCLAAAIALYPSKIVRVAGIGALLFSLSPVVSNMGTIAQFKGDSGSITFHARRAMSMFSPKDRTVTDSRPSWRIWPWQRSESRPNKSSNFRAF